MGKKFDEQMICNCSLSRKWWWGSIKVFDSPTKFLVYLDKEGSIDFDQANVKKVTVAYLCNRIDDGGGEFEGTDSHWAVCEPTANGAFAVWEINLSTLYSDPPSPEMVCPRNKEPIIITANMGEWKCPNCYKILIFHTKDDSIKIQNIIDHKCDIPSPEPPEKVSDEIIEELRNSPIKPMVLQKPEGVTIYYLSKADAKLILSELQQAGFGDLKEAKQYQAVFDELNFDRERKRFWEEIAEADEKIKEQEARIKELESDIKEWKLIAEARDKMCDVTKAKARQQAFQEAKQWLDELFKKGVSSFKYTSYSEGTYYLTFPYDDFTAVQNKIKSEQPKE